MKYFSLIFILISSLSANAATYTVNRTDDRDALCNSGVDCSLREAVKVANLSSDDDVINFSSVSLITLSSEIAITNNGTLAINGNGANVLTIDGGTGTNRIFYTNQANVTISGITLTGGNGTGSVNDGFGGAILAMGGSLTLEGIHLTKNSAEATGGMLLSGGTHFIINSTISANTSDLACGGLQNGTDSTLTVVNSTISGNKSGNVGGGLCSVGNTTLRNVTIVDNTAAIGGGGIVYVGRGTLTFGNTIVAGNISIDDKAPEISLPSFAVGIRSAGNNLIGNSLGDSTNVGFNVSITYQPTDILDKDPMIGALQNNGGTTPTHALFLGSPAINAGSNENASSTDQRGFPRIVGNTMDIGAYEFVPIKSRKRIRFF